MPYIHWESYRSHIEVSRLLEQIRADISKTRIWRSHTGQTNETYSGQYNEHSYPLGGDDGLPGTRDTKSTDYEKEFLKSYLYKRRPEHMRRTLHQYYYSYLADTRTRDRDQVVMRARHRKLRDEAKFSAKYVTAESKKDTMNKNKKWMWRSKRNVLETFRQTENEDPMPDGNSPVIMVDQLWFWIVSPSLSLSLQFAIETDSKFRFGNHQLSTTETI